MNKRTDIIRTAAVPFAIWVASATIPSEFSFHIWTANVSAGLNNENADLLLTRLIVLKFKAFELKPAVYKNAAASPKILPAAKITPV